MIGHARIIGNRRRNFLHREAQITRADPLASWIFGVRSNQCQLNSEINTELHQRDCQRGITLAMVRISLPFARPIANIFLERWSIHKCNFRRLVKGQINAGGQFPTIFPISNWTNFPSCRIICMASSSLKNRVGTIAAGLTR